MRESNHPDRHPTCVVPAPFDNLENISWRWVDTPAAGRRRRISWDPWTKLKGTSSGASAFLMVSMITFSASIWAKEKLEG